MNNDSRDVTNCGRSVKVELEHPLNMHTAILRTISFVLKKSSLKCGNPCQAYPMKAEHTNRRQLRRGLSSKLSLYMHGLMRARRGKYIDISKC